MNEVLQRVAYLRGLTDGLNIEESSNEGRVLSEIIDILDLMAEYVEDIDYRQSLIVEDIDEIDDDLADLEDYVYDSDSDYYDYPDFDDFEFDDFDDFDDDYLGDYDFFEDDEDLEENDDEEAIEF